MDIEQEQVDQISDAMKSIAGSILPRGVCGGNDETGAHVDSLTEAVMGLTSAGCKIALAIDGVANSLDRIADQMQSTD